MFMHDSIYRTLNSRLIKINSLHYIYMYEDNECNTTGPVNLSVFSTLN